jgi:hypothetical protein
VSLRRSFKETVMSSFLRSCALNCFISVTELIKFTRKKKKFFRAAVRLGNYSIRCDHSVITAMRTRAVLSTLRMTLNVCRERDMFHVRISEGGRILVK